MVQFLRGKKYIMNKVFKTYDRVAICHRRFPNVTFSNNFDLKNILKLSTDSFFVLLKNRDAEGRKIFLEKVAKRDTEEFDDYQAIKIRTYAIALAMYEEETQIAGSCQILDFSEISLKHLYSISSVLEVIELMNSCSYFKIPTFYLVNLPSFARVFLDTILSVAKEKLKQRIVVLKNSDDVKNFIDPDVLPKEYGGTKNFEEVVEDFSELHEKYGKYIKSLCDVKIDWNKVSENEKWNDGEEDSIGSFRKLAID